MEWMGEEDGYIGKNVEDIFILLRLWRERFFSVYFLLSTTIRLPEGMLGFS